jgi:uncharacterized protein involved in exopolysaccharide biosynthesis
MQEELTLRDYIAVAKRRWVFVVVPFVLVVLGSTAVALGLPPVYQSSGTILVESQQIPDQLVLSTVTGFADERIEVIKQRVMTRENLLRIAEKYRLFADQRRKLSPSDMVDAMREAIGVELVSGDGQRQRTKNTIAFTLSFEHRYPELALRVTNELVTLFLDENVKARTERAAETTDFLAQEAQKLRTQLEKLEEQIAAYKQEHQDALPEHLTLHTGMLERTQASLREVALQIKDLEQERRYLEVELTAARSGVAVTERSDPGVRITPGGELVRLKVELAQKLGVYQPAHPDIADLQRKIAALEKVTATAAANSQADAELAAAQRELALAEATYGPAHPDLKRLQAKVADRKVKATEAAKSAPADSSADVLAARVRAKMAAATEKIAQLEGQQEALKKRMAELEQRIVQTPQVERGLQSLTRDHENALKKYEEIKAKQLQAQVAENLEEGRKAERFLLLEPPLLPDKPIKPNRKKMLATGFVMAAAAGGGSLMLVESLNQSIRGPGSLTAILRQPPLAVIPVLETAAELRRRRNRIWKLLLLGVLLVLAALAAVHYLYMPLDIAWLKLIGRLSAM